MTNFFDEDFQTIIKTCSNYDMLPPEGQQVFQHVCRLAWVLGIQKGLGAATNPDSLLLLVNEMTACINSFLTPYTKETMQ